MKCSGSLTPSFRKGPQSASQGKRVELHPFPREEAGGESRPSWPPGVRLGCWCFASVQPGGSWGADATGRRAGGALRNRAGAGKIGGRTAEG